MEIKNKLIYEEAYFYLKEIYNNAYFKEGQYEAIEATIIKKRTLVVQKTGWGKSLVYFIATKIFRNQQKGVTFVVSPLLALMNNQLDAANKLGLKCVSLNSMVKNFNDVVLDIVDNHYDIVFITPETLFKDIMIDKLKHISISLFVIDEAHCISDWGHDFRLQYGNLYKIIKTLPSSVSILATTATANDRVVIDLENQLGEEVFVSRGKLIRDNLSIQVLKLNDSISRYAWLLDNLNILEGSGIIYCLTKHDCESITKFLNDNNIKALSYYSRYGDGELVNIEAEKQFMNNEIKVLVSTVKLGMGYDKPDIAFVIHYQQPSNIVSYYQQIGRAGRKINKAYTFLMCGSEDNAIHSSFIENAFPARVECEEVLEYIYECNEENITMKDLLSNINLTQFRIEKVLYFLLNEGVIFKENNCYYVTLKDFVYDEEKYRDIKNTRYLEREQMVEFINSEVCYNNFIVNCLDENTLESCKVCSNCLGYDAFSSSVSDESLLLATSYFNHKLIPIKPRLKWPCLFNDFDTLDIKLVNLYGLCLCKLGSDTYGQMILEDQGKAVYRNEIVDKSYELLKKHIIKQNINKITFVPSFDNDRVYKFAVSLSNRLDIPLEVMIIKNKSNKQSEMLNSQHKCKNVFKSYEVINDSNQDNILLIDEYMNSKWTLTVCGYLLMKHGAKSVIPFSLSGSMVY